ncbi:MAG: DEAD/DEAH box helicase [Acidimicrobiales bacterium]
MEPAVSEPAAVPAAEPESGFERLGLRTELLAALTTLGYEEPTPIQLAAIPPMMAGKDLLGQAATGTGKTAAFALPTLQRLAPGRRADIPIGLVLVPTRELAIQVCEAMHRYGKDLGARVVPIYGGQPIFRQLRALQAGVDIVVATPGRALDHIRRNTLRLDGLEVMILDEADEMLDMGFAEDLEAIFEETPETRQTVLFSATIPSRIARLARHHLTDPVRIEIERPVASSGEVPKVRQSAYVVSRGHKAAALGRVLDVENPTAALVFCRTRTEVDTLTEGLNGRGYRAEALHGGMSQEQRDRVMGRLRAGSAELLIATDVAARGLDIDLLTHVVNFDVPSDPDSYVHRIGRVGRAGREGVAITLAEPREHRLLKNIERVTGHTIAITKLPTVEDLRARRLELTIAAVREQLDKGELEELRVVVDTLSEDFDIVEIALAAVRLAHEATLGVEEDEEEIPDLASRTQRPERNDRYQRDDRGRGSERGGWSPRPDRGARPERAGSYERNDRPGSFDRDRPERTGGYDRPAGGDRPAAFNRDDRSDRAGGPDRGRPDRGAWSPGGDRPDRGDRGDRGDRPNRDDRGAGPGWDDRGRPRSESEDRGPAGRTRAQRPPSAGMTRLFVGLGHIAGLRPGDLVGAIAGETGLSGRQIGAIDISDRFALVEVPSDEADRVINALRSTSIKGLRANVRRERDQAR